MSYNESEEKSCGKWRGEVVGFTWSGESGKKLGFNHGRGGEL
jgi:hypothetical protein